MPIYEYKCGCGNVFEKLIMQKEFIVACPECNSKEVKKIISNSNFKLKGYWADTGYSKRPSTDNDIIKDGPVKSIDKLKARI